MIDIRTGDHFRDLTKKKVTMTRGGFIKSILASGIAPSITLGAASLAGSANATVGGMMRNVGARNTVMFGDGKPTARDYVQDGLIAMWDGIENAGWGVHTNTGNTWKNIASNNYNFDIGDIGSLGDDKVIMSKGIGVSQDWVIPTEPNATLEVVGLSQQLSYVAFSLMNKENGEAYMMFSILPSGNRGFQFSSRDSKSMYENWYSHRWSVAGTFVNSMRYNQYYNGVPKASNTGSSYWTTGGYDRKACFGYSYSSDTYCYVGELNCIRVYNRALSSDEIWKNYIVDKARFHLA